MLQLDPKKLRKRAWAEKRFRLYGILALLFAGGVLMLLVSSIVSSGHAAFFSTELSLELELDPETMGIAAPYTNTELMHGRYYITLKKSLYRQFPEVTGRSERRPYR